jgi:hypothetical protein
MMCLLSWFTREQDVEDINRTDKRSHKFGWNALNRYPITTVVHFSVMYIVINLSDK